MDPILQSAWIMGSGVPLLQLVQVSLIKVPHVLICPVDVILYNHAYINSNDQMNECFIDMAICV